MESPGQFPYTRGISIRLCTAPALWTSHFSTLDFGSAEESNQRYRYLLSQGTTGLSVAFDLPTQMSKDPDHPLRNHPAKSRQSRRNSRSPP